jgi:uncharacterized membrane protein
MKSNCSNWLIAFLAVACLTLGCPVTFAAESTSPGPDRLLLTRTTSGQKTFEVAQIMINASADRIYKILTDYQNAGMLFPGLKSCQILENRGSTKCVAYKVSPSNSLGTYQYQLEITETRNRLIEWHRVKGDLRAIDGSWKLEPASHKDRTVVTYSSSIQVGFFMPQALVNRQIRSGMADILYALKAKAEGTDVIADNPVSALGN